MLVNQLIMEIYFKALGRFVTRKYEFRRSFYIYSKNFVQRIGINSFRIRWNENFAEARMDVCCSRQYDDLTHNSCFELLCRNRFSHQFSFRLILIAINFKSGNMNLWSLMRSAAHVWDLCFSLLCSRDKIVFLDDLLFLVRIRNGRPTQRGNHTTQTDPQPFIPWKF